MVGSVSNIEPVVGSVSVSAVSNSAAIAHQRPPRWYSSFVLAASAGQNDQHRCIAFNRCNPVSSAVSAAARAVCSAAMAASVSLSLINIGLQCRLQAISGTGSGLSGNRSVSITLVGVHVSLYSVNGGLQCSISSSTITNLVVNAYAKRRMLGDWLKSGCQSGCSRYQQ